MTQETHEDLVKMIKDNETRIDELDNYIDHLDIIVYISIALNIILFIGMLISLNLR